MPKTLHCPLFSPINRQPEPPQLSEVSDALNTNSQLDQPEESSTILEVGVGGGAQVLLWKERLSRAIREKEMLTLEGFELLGAVQSVRAQTYSTPCPKTTLLAPVQDVVAPLHSIRLRNSCHDLL